MKKLFLALAVIFLLAGCNQNPDNNKDRDDDENTGGGSLDAQFLKGASADNAVILRDNGDGTSTVTLSGWKTVFIPISEDERNHDLMSYKTMTLNYQSTEQFRISLFDNRGDNLKPPSSAGGEEWSQWDYIGGAGHNGRTEVNISPIDRENVKYIGITAGGDGAAVTIRGIRFSRDNYKIQWDAQFAWYIKQIEDSVNESSKITANEDGTYKIEFLSVNAAAKFPVGRMSAYNLSQYTEMVINGINCEEGFRAGIFNSRDENIKPGAAENDKWWSTGSSGFSGNRTFSLTGIPAAELADTSYVLISCVGSARKPLTIRGITFNGDARKQKINLGTRPVSIKVDVSSVIRNVTHCASGALYGLTGSLPADINALVKPLSPYVYTQPARSGSGTQHSMTADALTIANRLKDTGTLVQIRLADMLPGWPYNFPGMNSWLEKVGSFIDDKLTSGLDNFDGYEIWNETWDEAKYGISFYNFWKQTYDLIRSKDPGVDIIGPSSAYYSRDRIKSFLEFCIANNCVPDIICWHELGTLANVARNMRDYRDLEKELGLPELPISINEYGAGMDEREMEGCPGSHAAYVAKFERYKIDSANISWWFSPGTAGYLGSLLTDGTQKAGGWYFYQWYGEMSGSMVSVTPSNENSKTADGFACVDEEKKYVSVLFGGANDGLIDVTISNLPSWLTSNPLVKVEKVDWTNRTTVSPGTVIISEKRQATVNNSITISLTNCTDTSGYRILITQ